MKTIVSHSKNIIFLKVLKTDVTSKAQLRNQSVLSLMTKLKKLQTRKAVYGNS